ncbi:hypothetical protein GGF39_003363 [Coemansia sp. RSA 1721]|nr:hypothetical protein GGF39_003363 [Coemansia sp. RSA 1721]
MFYQCDVGGTEVQKTCAPGTVCYSQGNTILCSYPVNTSGSQQPANEQLAAGASCSFSSPYDEYACPGPNGQYDYYLRCLSGNYVHFPCAPGTACIKNPGQNMFCGWKGQGGSPDVAAANATLPAIPSSSSSSSSFAVPVVPPMSFSDGIGGTISPSTAAIESSTTTTSPFVWDETTSSVFSESSTESGFGTSTESESAPFLSSTSSSSSGFFGEESSSVSSSSSGFLISMSIGVEESSTYGGIFTISSGIINLSESSDIAIGGTIGGTMGSMSEETPSIGASAEPSVAASSAEPVVAASSAELPAENSASPVPTASSHGSGLTGPMISSGLEMLLNNGIQLPITLPNIELPPIDLATVHLPDMTFDGIALTAIPLPSVTVPAFNPASLTKFSYIEELMSKAGVTFDDLAKLPLQDLQNLDLSHLDLNNMDINAIMSVVNVNRVSFPSNMVPTPLVEPVSLKATDPALQTTTLDADGIDALLGLSIMTYSSA